MAILKSFQRTLNAAITDVFLQQGWGTPDVARVALEECRDPAHGELASNAAMVLAKPVGQNPRAVAEALRVAFLQLPDVVQVDVAGPGFLNLRMTSKFWHNALVNITNDDALGEVASAGQGRRVNIEYVSANPTGPMHVGHGRGAVFGDVLANVLAKCGWNVTREYYINDAGGQIEALAKSVQWRVDEILGKVSGEMPEGLYPGDYLIGISAVIASEAKQSSLTLSSETLDCRVADAPRNDELAARSINAMMDMIRDDLAALHVKHDEFFSERTLTNPTDKIQSAIDWLEGKGYIYQGVLAPPKGELPDDWEAREQTLFRATEFGDTEDRALKKSDGAYTYFAGDVAYHANKLSRGYDRLIDVWGADHAGYVSRMKAVVKALSEGQRELEVALCQLVRLQRNGEPVRMSKRSGDFVTLREVVDEVGADAVRFMMIYRKADAPLDFDLAKVVEQSKDNPVFYVQYAHARIHSVLRHAQEQGIATPAASAVLEYSHLLQDEAEHALIMALARYPHVVEAAAETTEVHRIAFYLHDLASKFHTLWAKGNSNADLRFLQAGDSPISRARLVLCTAIAHVLQDGLGILGVSAPESM